MSPMKPRPLKSTPPVADTMSLAQLSRRWKVSCRQIRRMLGNQQLGFVAICGELRIPRAEVKRYERRHGRQGPQATGR